MQFSIKAAEPKMSFLEPEKNKGGLLSAGSYSISARPSQVVFYGVGRDISLLAARGNDSVSKELDKKVYPKNKKEFRALCINRNFSIDAHISEVQFSGGCQGYVSLFIPLRFLTHTSEPHPVIERMPAVSPSAFQDALADCLSGGAGPELRRIFAGVEYEPAAAIQRLSESLSVVSSGQEFVREMAEKTGLAIADTIIVQDAGAPEEDRRINKEQERKKEAEARRQEVGQKMGEESAKMAISSAEHEREMQEARQQTEKELAELHRQQKEEEIRTSISLKKELADLKKQEKQAEVDKKNKEAKLVEKKIGAVEAELKAVSAFEQRVESLEQLLQAMQEDRTSEAEDPLGMMASWRALNETGVIIPQLGSYEKLPSGTMLDLNLTVNREAYVYVLLQNSSSDWQCLVPDADKLMGIKKQNFQRANQTETWPGVNKHLPDLPYWCLDREPGYERFVVLASLEPIDPMKVLESEGVEGLREEAAPIGTRGLCNPVDYEQSASAGLQPHGAVKDYRRVVKGLMGDGKVMEEMVVEHV